MTSTKMIGIGLFLLMSVAAVNLCAADLLPLAPGNNWTYRDAVTGQTFIVQVGTQVYLNQHVYHTLRGYGTEPLLVRASERGNIVYWDVERGIDVLLISFDGVSKDWWEAPRRECPQEGQTQEARGVHDGPGGQWEVVEIHYRTPGCFDAGHLSEQFAENIGLVRRVANTFAGPRTFDLVYARVGTQVISARNAGSFNVIAAPAARPGFWLATLRIDLPLGTAVKLNFPSSQEYDARLRDSQGNILWTWSADKLFAQVQHQRRISGGFSATIAVPFPPATPEGPHFYTLEAWMTNAEHDPQFGAVTGVEIPSLSTPRGPRVGPAEHQTGR